MDPSAWVAVTVHWSPLRTQPSAGAKTPVVLAGDHLVADPGRPPTGHVHPCSSTSPAATRSARARALSSPTLPRSPAIIRLVRPASVSVFPPPIEGVEHLVPARPR